MKRFLLYAMLAASALAIVPAAAENTEKAPAEDARQQKRSERQQKIIDEESGKLAPLEISLSDFSSFRIEPITYSDAVAKEEKKVKATHSLDGQLRARLDATFAAWSANAPVDGPTLVIKPYVVTLKMVSGGARFWGGALAGDSEITLDLKLLDGDTGSLLGQVTIAKSSSAMAGAWSFGASDNNLDMYIVEIANRFLENNYPPKQGAARPAKLLTLPAEGEPAVEPDSGAPPAESEPDGAAQESEPAGE